MLKFFRNNRALLITLFIICGGAMVFVLIGGPGGGGGHTAGLKGTAANVNGEKISVQDLTQEVNQRWAQAQRRLDEQFPLGEANSAQNRRFMEQLIRQQYSPDRVLDSLIHDRYFYSLTKDNRVAVSDEAVRQYLYQIPAFQKDGRFDPIAYRQMISRPGDFEGDITRQLAKDAFLQQFAVSLRHISAGEKEILDSLNEARVFETVTLNAKSISAAKKPSEAELSQWQETEEAKKAVKAYFEENKSKYEEEEKVHARHILIKENEGGLKKINEVRKEIVDGKITFEEAAKKYSSDKSNSDKGGDLGFFDRKMMVPEFSKVAFSLSKKDDISQALKSPFGFHIIQLIERKEATKKTLAEVSAEIAPIVYAEEKAKNNLKTIADEWVKKSKGPTDADLKKYKLSWVKAPTWTPMDRSLGRLGEGVIDAGELLSLDSENAFLARALRSADDYVFVRFVSKVDDQSAAKSSNAAQKAAEGSKEFQATGDKARRTFLYYYDKQYKDLESAKKIIKSDKVIAELRARLNQITN